MMTPPAIDIAHRVHRMYPEYTYSSVYAIVRDALEMYREQIRQDNMKEATYRGFQKGD